MAEITCLWGSSLHRALASVVLVQDLDETRSDTLVLRNTDLTSTPGRVVARYASRRFIGRSIWDGKNLLGVGDADDRLPTAVVRSTPRRLASQTVLILWYDQASQPNVGPHRRRQDAPWYRHMNRVAVENVIITFRLARRSEIDAAQDTPDPYGTTAPTSAATAA